MDIVIRGIEDDELDGWIRFAEGVFFMPTISPEFLAVQRSAVEVDRTLGAFDGDRLVGTTSAISFSMTIPGGADVPVAGVTVVTVSPTHRRRGILTEMMRHQLDDVAARGEAIAVLNASEATIYDRFGYGPAVDEVRIEIDTRTAAFRDRADTGGFFELLEDDTARAVAADVYERCRQRRAGSLSRTPAWWRTVISPVQTWKGGGDLYVVVHRSPSGEADGFALYLLHGLVEHGLQLGTVELRDLVAVDDDVEAALWRYCLDLDLVVRLTAVNRPVDEPLRWRLVEPRQLRTTAHVDLLWLRLVDVARALADRRYAVEDSLVLEVVDPFLPRNDGVFRLSGSPDGAECRATADPPDLRVDVSALGSAYLGGVRFSTLAAGGRVLEHTPGAVRRADALFVTPRAPHCTTRF